MKVTRFEKLKSLREDLCEREKNRLVKIQYQKWLLDQVKELKKISECKDCGESNPLVLDFDHVRGKKIMCISNMVRNSYSIETIQKEIDKCEVRCANCHRLITYKRRNEQADCKRTT